MREWLSSDKFGNQYKVYKDSTDSIRRLPKELDLESDEDESVPFLGVLNVSKGILSISSHEIYWKLTRKVGMPAITPPRILVKVAEYYGIETIKVTCDNKYVVRANGGKVYKHSMSLEDFKELTHTRDSEGFRCFVWQMDVKNWKR